MSKGTVLMCLSGGVDSSVAAALLIEQGYEVTGAYMKQWSDSVNDSGSCTWREDRRDAIRTAAHLGIQCLTLDFEKEYKEWVMSYLYKEYEAGRTPNPDVMCNKFIKFGVWMEKAKELGFHFMATGHYASIDKSGDVALLQRAKDDNKDQTYFLHQITSKELETTLFPLGTYTKPEVRELAKKFALPTAEREESMGICFVGEVPMKDFLQKNIAKSPGNIVFSDGTVLGQHEGLAFYTIGQRNVGAHSGGLSGMQKGENKPLYVVQKRFDTNELVVGFAEDPLLYKTTIDIDELHYISGISPGMPFACQVRFRHRQSLQEGILDQDEQGRYSITTKEPQRAMTPGQFAVLYADDICIGGGVIA